MSVLTPQMRRMVSVQRLGFVATVNQDGTPNLSPKGTVAVWKDERLVFADIRSPGTIRNLKRNPSVEINVVDPMLRKGYRFRGRAEVLESGPLFDEVVASYRERGVKSPICHIVVVEVEKAAEMLSPVYDVGASEHEVMRLWRRYWAAIDRGLEPPSTGE